MVVLGHIAGIPVQESLAYVAPVGVVVAFIHWSGRRERRRAEQQPGRLVDTDDDLDALLGPDPAAPTPPGGAPQLD